MAVFHPFRIIGMLGIGLASIHPFVETLHPHCSLEHRQESWQLLSVVEIHNNLCRFHPVFSVQYYLRVRPCSQTMVAQNVRGPSPVGNPGMGAGWRPIPKRS